MQQSELDSWHMRRALELADHGQGFVEPNPLVGCVIVRGAEVIGEGWHRRHGGPHAEIEALAMAGSRAAGSTLYVTLEPCSHQGKTPPCAPAVINAGIRRVVAALDDPFDQVAGRGFQQLRAAGIDVIRGVCEAEARRQNAPYLKCLTTGFPWVIAKWAMTLDGKIATHTRDSRWISSEASRQIVHDLRGRVDAIIVGQGTATADNPLLTARPPGARTATRVVLDRLASLATESQLVRTSNEAPVLIVVSSDAKKKDVDRLKAAGCEIFVCDGHDHAEQLEQLLEELGRRKMTNVLVEGGQTVLGALFDRQLVDEVHAFIAPKLVGSATAPGPIGGSGVQKMAAAWKLETPQYEQIGEDLYLHGVLRGRIPGNPDCA